MKTSTTNRIKLYLVFIYIILYVMLLTCTLSAQGRVSDGKPAPSSYSNEGSLITSMQYTIEAPNIVKVKLYDETGWELKTIINEYQQPGSYSVNFNSLNLANGVYFYRIDAGSIHDFKKIILSK